MENNDTLEVIQRIPLDKLRPYPDHPFGVRDDDMMQQTVESIKQFGVLVPGIARPLPDGTFELIAGHRRKQASAVAGLDDMPIIVRDIDRNAATIIMVDSNLQRENILPSEKAKAYKMKLEAIKRQAGRPGKNSAQLGQNFEGKTSRAQIAANSPDSSSQIQRYTQFKRVWQYIVTRSTKERTYVRYINGQKITKTVTPVLGEKAAHNGNVVYSLDFQVTPHQLRHTYITNLIYASVDPKTVQYLAGHENSKITMDIYAKVKYNKPEQLSAVVNTAFGQPA